MKKVLIITVILLIAIAVFGIHILLDVTGTIGGFEQVVVDIPAGASNRDIAKILKDSKVITYPAVYRMVNSNRNDAHFGKHVLTPRMSHSEIAETLSQFSTYDDGVRVTIPEGWELRHIIDALEEQGLIDRAAFIQAMEEDYDFPFLRGITREENRLEGYLFPATYSITLDMTERDIVEAMLSKFDQEYDEELRYRTAEIGATMDEIVTLASVIEREVRGDQDQFTAASVFWNRIKSSDMPYLQSCATVQYVLKERKAVLSNRDIEIDSPYNTYKFPGLPVGPIASPGRAAIVATLYPAETDYYFFLVGLTGETIFSRNIQEHEQAKRENGL